MKDYPDLDGDDIKQALEYVAWLTREDIHPAGWACGTVFHTYSTYGRGCDGLVGAYNFLDLAPKGRDEGGLDFTMPWVRHHDRYGA